MIFHEVSFPFLSSLIRRTSSWLAFAAVSLGKMPHQSGDTAPKYQQLASELEQLGKLEEIIT
jgi:hypothetical protein